MNRRSLVSCLGALALMLALTVAVVQWLPPVVVSNHFGIRHSLPEQMGGWKGRDMVFCQNMQCLRHYETQKLAGQTNCPACGGALDDWAPGEKNLLPADTKLVRKVYYTADQPPIQVSIVFSGSDQKSIHRPQQCLRAQGLVIEHSRTVDVDVPQRPPLSIMCLTIRPQGRGLNEQGLFGYWFIGGSRETPYHFSRLAWMSWDRLIYGRANRWAYVSIYLAQTGTMDNGLSVLRRFLRDLVPLLASESPPSPDSLRVPIHSGNLTR